MSDAEGLEPAFFHYAWLATSGTEIIAGSGITRTYSPDFPYPRVYRAIGKLHGLAVVIVGQQRISETQYREMEAFIAEKSVKEKPLLRVVNPEGGEVVSFPVEHSGSTGRPIDSPDPPG